MKEKTPEVIRLLKADELYEVFSDCAKKGIGIEINMKTIFSGEEEKDILLRPYFIAKDCGCKFYMGSDSHKTEALAHSKEGFERAVTLLSLTEDDKFPLCR